MDYDEKNNKNKKTVPKGKKRVKKTRCYEDNKGYMVTEEYSSYEEIDDVPAMIKHEIPKMNEKKRAIPSTQAP